MLYPRKGVRIHGAGHRRCPHLEKMQWRAKYEAGRKCENRKGVWKGVWRKMNGLRSSSGDYRAGERARGGTERSGEMRKVEKRNRGKCGEVERKRRTRKRKRETKKRKEQDLYRRVGVPYTYYIYP